MLSRQREKKKKLKKDSVWWKIDVRRVSLEILFIHFSVCYQREVNKVTCVQAIYFYLNLNEKYFLYRAMQCSLNFDWLSRVRYDNSLMLMMKGYSGMNE